MPRLLAIFTGLCLSAASLPAAAPAMGQPDAPAITTRLILPPDVDFASVRVAVLAVNGDSTREVTRGRPAMDSDGFLTAPYSDPGPAATVLLRFTYPAAPGSPDRLWLAAPDPARADLSLPTGQPPTSRGQAAVSFRPSTHGFRFVNRFEASSRSVSLGRALGISLDAFGLCGGMSFAAADLFLAGRSAPETSAPPPAGSPLYGYLYRRQSDSLGGLAVEGLRFARWMALPQGTPIGTNKRSYDELPALRANLDAGRLVVLGLNYVSSSDRQAVWQNHQVLATGYTAGGDGAVTIQIYDPNYPGRDDMTIRASLLTAGAIDDPRTPGAKADVPGLDCRQFLGERELRPVRGFFVMPYAPAAPPGDLSPVAPGVSARTE